MDCTIIICTRNRAHMLERTLADFGKVAVPQGMQVELIVVDNGSTDQTQSVVRAAKHDAMQIRHLSEPVPGHSRALNTAIREARSDVLLFTDDDVEPAADWVEKMAQPLLQKKCAAVAGRIELGKDLQREWLTGMHKVWLAITSPTGDSPMLVGACMGLHRSVFERIDKFNEDLGPGALGYGADMMIWQQIKEAGLSILPVTDTFVIHHPERSRLLRANWLSAAVRFGQTDAYFKHHWEHCQISWPRFRALLIRTKLSLRRLPRRVPALDAEGVPLWEMFYLMRLSMLESYIYESSKVRMFELRGLRRRRSLDS